MRHIRGLICSVLILLTAACSSGSEEGSSDDLVNAFTVSGSIGDGPIVNADVALFDADGNLVGTTTSDAAANYTVDVPGQTPLPITVRVNGGTDLVTQRAADFELKSLVHTVGTQTLNVSPLTTLAVNAAVCGGDTSAQGLNRIWQAIDQDLNMGLDSALLLDPMGQAITTDNVEAAVLANEALGEWVRRTGQALTNAGFSTDLDTVVDVLGCDLADGSLDGAMAAPVGSDDARILAVAKAAEIAVRLEVLAGRLEVDGTDATSAMNNAIASIMPSVSNPDVNSVALSMQGATQLRDALAVLQGVYGDDELVNLMQVLETVDQNRLRDTMHATLSPSVQNTMQGLGERVALADVTAIDEINSRQQAQNDALPPIVSLSADPSAVETGGSTTLSWASSNADQCEAEGGWSGAQALQGTFASGSLERSVSYTLTCFGVGGVTSSSVAVTVAGQPVPDAPTVTLNTNASQITAGDSVVLSWSSTDASSCSASGGWSGARAASGTASVGPLQADTTFMLSCSGAGGSASDSVSVTVTPEPVDPPTLSFTTSASSVDAGDSVTLSWNSGNADSCSASGDWSGARSTSGQQSVGPLSANASFSLSCSGIGGTASDTVNVSVVVPRVPTVSLSATPSTVSAGDSVSLTWSSTEATSCTASGGWSGARATSGTVSVGPLQADTVFSLSCSGAGGSASDSASVTVTSEPVDPPTLSFTSSAVSVDAGDSVTLSWNSSNTNNCSASGDWSGARSVSGQQSVGPLNADASFSLSCDGAGGTVSQTVDVSVNAAPPPSLSFNASAAVVSSGGSVTLTWNATDADSCTASGGWSGARSPSGQEVISNLQETATYTLSCAGSGGSVVEMVSVAVTGSLDISWQAPSEDVNGAPVTSVASYRIYYGASSRNYDDYVEVSGTATSHTLQLVQGQYYLAVTAINDLAEESEHSNEIRKSAR